MDGAPGLEDPGRGAGRGDHRMDNLRVKRCTAGLPSRSTVIRLSGVALVAGEHRGDHLEPRKRPHQGAVIRAESGQVLGCDERDTCRFPARSRPTRRSRKKLFLPHVVGDRGRVLAHQNMCRVTGESVADPRQQALERDRSGWPEIRCCQRRESLAGGDLIVPWGPLGSVPFPPAGRGGPAPSGTVHRSGGLRPWWPPPPRAALRPASCTGWCPAWPRWGSQGCRGSSPCSRAG